MPAIPVRSARAIGNLQNEGYRLLAEGGAGQIEAVECAMNQDTKALIETVVSYSYYMRATAAGVKASAGAKITKSASSTTSSMVYGSTHHN